MYLARTSAGSSAIACTLPIVAVLAVIVATNVLAPPPAAQRLAGVNVSVIGYAIDRVPGLAEKLFPQKVIEDPLLRDDGRSDFPELETSAERIAAERLALLDVDLVGEDGVLGEHRHPVGRDRDEATVDGGDQPVTVDRHGRRAP